LYFSPGTCLELAQNVVVLDVAKPLQDDLAGGAGGDPAETGGSVLEFTDRLAVVVDFGRPDGHVSALAVQLRTCLLEGPGCLVVGHQKRLLNGGDQEVQRDFTLTLQEP
jgi:hypothetical protein